METPIDSVELLFESLETYSKTTFELAKLKALESFSKGIAALFAKIGVVIMLLLFGVLLSIGASLMLGELLGKTYYGFFVVAGFYLILGLLAHFFLYHWIKGPIGNTLINQVFQ
ncbi:hypothetical protein [Haliscomenobacter sp.]|uniref:hypothetical protein n=1 Tax=Haliscomenobacter sp. TaxID=2717303 RepID=UPI003BACF387